MGEIFNELKNGEERDKKAMPSLQYKYVRYGLLVYFGIVVVIMVVFAILMNQDSTGNLPFGIALLVLFVLVTVVFLLGFKLVKKKMVKEPEVRAEVRHPVKLPFSESRYNAFRKKATFSYLEKGRLDQFRYHLADLLMNGNLDRAMVVSADPFVIAVFDDVFDASLLMVFPVSLLKQYGLQAGDRLVAATCYYEKAFEDQGAGRDVFPGPRYNGAFEDLCPAIPLFLTDDREALQKRAEEFSEEEWQYAVENMKKTYEKDPDNVRSGLWIIAPSEERWSHDPIHDAKWV